MTTKSCQANLFIILKLLIFISAAINFSILIINNFTGLENNITLDMAKILIKCGQYFFVKFKFINIMVKVSNIALIGVGMVGLVEMLIVMCCFRKGFIW